MRPALMAGLPRIGIVKNFPRALVHGLKKFLGLAIPHLFGHQLTDHIQEIILSASPRHYPENCCALLCNNSK
jgi:hypothetical protein